MQPLSGGGGCTNTEDTEVKMAESVKKAGVVREPGWLYYLDKSGNISRAPMRRGAGKKAGRPQRVATVNVKREDGFLYYITKDGDVARAPMNRGTPKKKATPRSIVDALDDLLQCVRELRANPQSKERMIPKFTAIFAELMVPDPAAETARYFNMFAK